MHSSLRLKVIRGATGKVAQEQLVGESQSADGVWVQEVRVLDREADLERHEVSFPDGRPAHRHEGGLSEKRGHGSDKPELRAAREAERQRRQEARAARKAERDQVYRARTDPGPAGSD